MASFVRKKFSELTEIPSPFRIPQLGFSLRNMFSLVPENKNFGRFVVSAYQRTMKIMCREGGHDLNLCMNYIKEFAVKRSLQLTCSDVSEKVRFEVTSDSKTNIDALLLHLLNAPGFFKDCSLYFNFTTKDFFEDVGNKIKDKINASRAHAFSVRLDNAKLNILTTTEYHSHTDEYFGDIQKIQIESMSAFLRSFEIETVEGKDNDRLTLSITNEENIVMLMDFFGKMHF